jgi:glucose-1-phosphate thymidylyltransferase
LAIVDASRTQDGGDGPPRPDRYLTSIANQPLIAHALAPLASIGVQTAAIAAAPGTRGRIASSLGDGEQWGLQTRFMESSSPIDGVTLTAHLRDLAWDEPVLLVPGDCLFGPQLGQLARCFTEQEPDMALLVSPQRARRIRPVGGNGTVSPLRLPYECPDGTATILAPSVWPALGQITGSPTGSALLERASAEQFRIAVCDVGPHRRYDDAPEQLLAANRMLLDALAADEPFTGHGEGVDVTGRVSVSPTARVSRSALQGPVAIGEDAVVEDSFVGPYTAIAARAQVIGTEIDDSMVLADAQIRHPGHRLHASVIGEGANVTQSFALPSGLHLWIGPGASVRLS